MTFLQIEDDALVQTLYQIAEDEDRSLEDILREFAENRRKEQGNPNPFLAMIEVFQEANLEFREENILAHMREIMDDDADEILSRIRDNVQKMDHGADTDAH